MAETLRLSGDYLIAGTNPEAELPRLEDDCVNPWDSYVAGGSTSKAGDWIGEFVIKAPTPIE